MRIAHLLWNLGTGGIETMLVDIANCQAAMPERHQVCIIVVNDVINEEVLKKLDPRVKVYQCGRKAKSRSLAPIIRLNNYLLKYRADVMHFHAPGLRKMVFVPGKKGLTIHTTGYKPEQGKGFDQLYAISNSVREEWLAQGVETTVVANGIPCSEIAVKEHYWNQDGIFRIIQVSRISLYHKGQDLLVKAVAKLRYEGVSNVHVTFVGEGEDMPKLKETVTACGLEDAVEFLGLRDRSWVYPHLKDYDLFVQPSLFEGFGLTVAEACAAGIPVLVSENEGPLEIICNGKYGATFKNKDIDDLAAKLKMIMEGDYAKLVSKTSEAREHVLNTYDVHITAKKYMDEYAKLV